MTRNEFISEIENLLEVAPGTFTGETFLGDIERWDSLAVVGFIALVDENLGFTPPPKKIAASKTLEDLVKLVGSYLEESPPNGHRTN
jgi:acyl carrier protein